MARTGKRRGNESSGISADNKKRKPSPLKITHDTSSKDGSRIKKTSPLRSSFKQDVGEAKRVSPPVTFNQAVDYDDGSQSDMSKPFISRQQFGLGSLGNALNEEAIAMNGPAQTSGLQTPQSDLVPPNGRFGNLAPSRTPGAPKKNPWYHPPTSPQSPTTATPQKKSPDKNTPQDKVPEKATPEKKTAACPKPQTWEELSKKYITLPKHDAKESGRKVIKETVREPRALTLEEASDALVVLRDQIRTFGTTHFSFELTAQEKRDWPLADLLDKNPEFVSNCAYIADGSQYGWRQLFTESYCRPQLVTGLLAHYIVEHVFKHTCFGLNDAELASLEDDVLKRYIHWDGFVRSKQLAVEISKIFTSKPLEDQAFDKFTATTDLTSRILSTIAPLLPTCKNTQAATSASLKEIVTNAQALALSIRLTGANRTVFRFTFPTKHSEYQLGGGQNCLNIARVDATRHHAPDHDRDELRVKIPCWPTIIATVPSGPDMLDFASDPSLLERAGREIPPETGAPPRNPGAYVTEVFMTPSDVYCEWTPLASPLQFPLKLTLWQAIQHAKRDRARALGLPWPPVAPWKRTATRTAAVVLGAAAVGGLAYTAVKATTPHGRRLLLAAAKRVTQYIQRSKAAVAESVEKVEDVMEEVIKDAAAGAASKASFFSVFGKTRRGVSRA